MNLRHQQVSRRDSETSNGRLESFTEQLGQFWRRNLMWILLAGLALLILQDVFGLHGVLAMRRAQHESTSEQQEIKRINQENVQLQNRVNSLKTDPQAIERIAREQMGLARPGEYIFKIPPPVSQKNAGHASPAPGTQAGAPAKTP